MGTAFRATYRLQLTPDFGFAAAARLIPYLRDLGVSHLYLSPSLQARPGSTHGYDVIDPTRISTDLGGEDEFRELAQAAQARPAWGSSSTWSPITWPPTRPTASGATPS